ncbi:hypothetical protein GCM10020331_069130 [Ectobacillus funiculus]
MEHFGESLPATGLALEVDQIVRVLKEQNPPSKEEPTEVLIHYSLETIEEAERLRALYIKEGVKTELSMMSSLEETFSFARANKVAAVVDTSGGKLKEYAWKEKNGSWKKEGETSCVTFKSR